MDFIISASTDIGILKDINEDALSVKLINTSIGKMVFAVLCDGMGGLEKGEVASANVINAFNNWLNNELPLLSNDTIRDDGIFNQWNNIIQSQNDIISCYGKTNGFKLGTTAVVMLITQSKYYVLNVGDSRAYELRDNNSMRQITKDQTLLERELELGHITREQMKNDKRRSILLQCVGASKTVIPDIFLGATKPNTTYLLCSDGFYHTVSNSEIYSEFSPNILTNYSIMSNNINRMIDINKARGECDNISVILIKAI